ncbi:MAG TPA: MFS transporter [Sphingobium sp.]
MTVLPATPSILPDAGAQVEARPTAERAWWTIVLLGILYILSLIDRMILALLVAPLKADLALDDVHIGLLVGTAFAIVYGVLGLPLARLADRGNRHLIIVAGVAIWSLSTIGSAFANSFEVLVALRLGLAIGEAALLPATFSMIGDLFPREKRTLAASIFSAMGSAGAGASFIIGAAIIGSIDWLRGIGLASAQIADWRLVLIAVGLPGILLIPVLLLTIREPSRRTVEGKAASPTLGALLEHVQRHIRMYIGLISCAFSGTVSYAFVAWLPELMRRLFGWTPAQSGWIVGVILIASCLIGTIAGPRAAEWLMRRGRGDGFLLVILGAFTAGIVCAIVTAFQQTPFALLFWYFFASTFLASCSNCTIASFQILTPANMRGTVVATYMLVIGIAGLGIGPPLSAWLAQTLFTGNGGLGQAMAAVAVVVGIPVCAIQIWSRPAFSRRMAEGED